MEPHPCTTAPCIDPVFGPSDFNYWSSTTFAGSPGSAWYVGFTFGAGATSLKVNAFSVRAVRGGL